MSWVTIPSDKQFNLILDDDGFLIFSSRKIQYKFAAPLAFMVLFYVLHNYGTFVPLLFAGLGVIVDLREAVTCDFVVRPMFEFAA